MVPSTAKAIVSCDKRRRLAEKCSIAAQLYSEAATQLTGTIVNGISAVDFDRRHQNVEKAGQKAERLLVALKTHIETHKCLE
jgi:hypothetical protein